MSRARPNATALLVAIVAALLAANCSRGRDQEQSRDRPSILVVTLDTTRADAIGPGAKTADTPAFNALATRGRLFRQAYATVPETLPSHSSMMTGLYPAGHGVHENARYLSGSHTLMAERLNGSGYKTAAFVSSFVLAKQFGLARGFDVFDDELGGAPERRSRETTDRAIAYLSQAADAPLLLWVHYFDPHTPFEPLEPYRSRYAASPYHGEIAAMDEQLGRLIQAFETRARRPTAILVVGDHGEGLGDHGESQHGNLLYQSTMHVPFVLVAPGVAAAVEDTPVSTRRVFHTVLDLAGVDGSGSLIGEDRTSEPEIVLGEAMKPFLSYGWQPQVMAVGGHHKALRAGRIEAFDLAADPDETRPIDEANVPPALREVLEGYPIPSADQKPAAEALTDEAKKKLAALGYVSASATPPVRRDAPRPADMIHLFDALERASALFVRERYAEVIPLLERILKEDPNNLDAVLRLATAHSSLGHDGPALAAFKRAAAIAPRSPDVRTYLALHYGRGRTWPQAVPLLEQIVQETPERLPALEALARVRERQGRMADAVELRLKIHALRKPTTAELLHLGRVAMAGEQTRVAVDAFEKARARPGAAFEHDLELGVLYLAERRLENAKAALDRVPQSHPEYPMALFKRAQVSVLLNEPDRAERIARARQHADETTRELIARERLFR